MGYLAGNVINISKGKNCNSYDINFENGNEEIRTKKNTINIYFKQVFQLKKLALDSLRNLKMDHLSIVVYYLLKLIEK